MPLARIDLAQRRTADYRKTIGDVVYDAQVEVLNAPKNDRFQVITEHPGQNFIFEPSILGHSEIERLCVYRGHAQCRANRGSETYFLQSNRGRAAPASQLAPGRRVHLSG
jgi:hypothetical protein